MTDRQISSKTAFFRFQYNLGLHYTHHDKTGQKPNYIPRGRGGTAGGTPE